LTGEQIIALLLSGIYDPMTGSTELPQPLTVSPTTGQQPATVNDPNAQCVVDMDAPDVAAGSNFGSFEAPFDGTAVLTVCLSSGGILFMTVANATESIIASGPLQKNYPIPPNCWQRIKIGIRYGQTYSFQTSLAGVATHYVLASPQLQTGDDPWAAGVDQDDNLEVTAANSVFVHDYTVPAGKVVCIASGNEMAVGNLTVNGTLIVYGIMRCSSFTCGTGIFVLGDGGSIEMLHYL
jgi:hypothetical protein